MEQNANALPKVTLGQYKGLEFTRRVRPVSEKAVELEPGNERLQNNLKIMRCSHDSKSK